MKRLALIFLTVISLPALSQSMRPGLWEVDSKISSKNPQMAAQMAQLRKQLASMPPEQRKMMEQMLAKQGGASMPTMTDDGMRVKICMSKEMVAQNQVPVQQTGNCKQQQTPMGSNAIKISFVCTNPASSGEGTVQFEGETGYTMNMNLTAAPQGKPETTTVQADGRWLGADCGAVKPQAPAAPKPR